MRYRFFTVFRSVHKDHTGAPLKEDVPVLSFSSIIHETCVPSCHWRLDEILLRRVKSVAAAAAAFSWDSVVDNVECTMNCSGLKKDARMQANTRT